MDLVAHINFYFQYKSVVCRTLIFCFKISSILKITLEMSFGGLVNLCLIRNKRCDNVLKFSVEAALALATRIGLGH